MKEKSWVQGCYNYYKNWQFWFSSEWVYDWRSRIIPRCIQRAWPQFRRQNNCDWCSSCHEVTWIEAHYCRNSRNILSSSWPRYNRFPRILRVALRTNETSGWRRRLEAGITDKHQRDETVMKKILYHVICISPSPVSAQNTFPEKLQDIFDIFLRFRFVSVRNVKILPRFDNKYKNTTSFWWKDFKCVRQPSLKIRVTWFF